MFRLSFVKGWGPDYPRRDIENTPCWIDLNFFNAVPNIERIVKEIYGYFRIPQTSSVSESFPQSRMI